MKNETAAVLLSLIVILSMAGCVSDPCSNETETPLLVPVRSGDYVHIYRPQPDVFPGPDTAELVAGQVYDEWVPNDHCFVKGPDDLWHAFGITHPKTSVYRVHDGEHQSFHARSPKDTLRKSIKPSTWKDLPKILPPAERPGEIRENHAPYIVKKDGLYYMIYGPSPLRYATSEDLYQWTVRGPLDNSPPGRDPSVFFWQGKYYLITCGNHQVYMASSKDLIHWEDQRVILKMEGIDPESPSMVIHNGTFYLFVCGWNGIWDKKDISGAYQHITYVYQSDTPFEFNFGHELTRLDAHAPEIIRDEKGRWYMSSVEYPNRGVSIAPLKWITQKKK